jgi:hypothetical protein
VISTFMAENFLLTRVILVVGFVAAVVVAIVLARGGARGRRAATVIAAAAGILVLALTLSPDPTGVQSEVVCNLTPYSFWADALNMALFLLPALFAVVALRRPALVALAVPVVSAAIELAQYLVPAFGRRCDVDDWLANVIGGVIGVLLGLVALGLASRRSTEAERSTRS